LAHVSPSTASRALNGHGDVSVTTRAAVEAAAATLQFRPSPLARSLRMQRSHTIGLVVPDVAHPFYAAILKGAEALLENAGYRLMLMDSDQDVLREQAALGLLVEHQVDGLLVCTAGLSEQAFVDVVEFDGPPCIFIDDVVTGAGAGTVRIENNRGMELLVDHLIEVHGHRALALVVGPDQGTSGAERRAGFEAAVARHRSGSHAMQILECPWTVESARSAVRALLADGVRPDAIVTASAELALGALAAARDLGVGVPADVALVCFDDPYYGRYLDPPMTSIAYDAAELGREAAEMLVASLETDDVGQTQKRIDVTLKVRRSCGCGGEA
jgi:LacI family transcriptional regulator